MYKPTNFYDFAAKIANCSMILIAQQVYNNIFWF